MKKKITKKRGRIKWTDEHDLLLKGCSLLFEDNEECLKVIFPQFNSAMIYKKLKDLNWRKYFEKGKNLAS